MNYLTVKQAAALLSVTPTTITRWVKAGHFPGAIKLNPSALNSPIRIPQADVETYAATRSLGT